MRESPARAQPHDATAWLPLPDFAELPPLDRLLVPDPESEPAAPRDVPGGLPSPARAEPHDATAWLPLPELEELPSVDTLLEPDPTVTPPAPREVTVGLPSPARAEPHDATAWLPLPELDPVPVGSGNGGQPPTRRHRRVRRFHLPYRALLTLAALCATCAAAYVGVTVLLDKGPDVEIRVDGQRFSAETGVATVGDALAEQGVELGTFDRAIPDVSAPIENGMSVRVLRAFPVPVSFDGSPTVVQTTYRNAEGFATDAEAQLSPGTPVGLHEPPERITELTTVEVRTRKIGVLQADGQIIEYDSPALTVRELLADLDIVLDEADVTGPIGLDDVLPTMQPNGDRVSIALFRVQNKTFTEDEPYTLPDEIRPDDTVPVTTPYRVVPGVPGVQRVTYLLIHENGVVTEQVPIAYEPLNPAQPTITYYGTIYNPRWDKIAECETGTNWEHTGSGNGGRNTYQGGLGIWYGNWDSYKDDGWPKDANEATKYQQIVVAERIKDDHGWGAWGCSKTLGYAKEDGKRIT